MSFGSGTTCGCCIVQIKSKMLRPCVAFLWSSSPQVTVTVGGQSNVIPGLVVSYSPPAISNLSTTLFSTAGMKCFCFPHDRREMHTHTCSSWRAVVGTSTQSCVVICSSLTRLPLVSTLHSGGTNVVVTGSSFGPVAAVQVVTYSSPAAVNGPVYTAVCSRGADLGSGAETLQCAAQPGVGAGLLWSVQVEGQTSQVFNVSTAYRPPTITVITGRVWTACCLLCVHCTECTRPTSVALLSE